MNFHAIFLLVLSIWLKHSDGLHEDFVKCMSMPINSTSKISISKYIHTPNSQSYKNLLQSAEQNPRWYNSTTRKPRFIVTPYSEIEIQAAILCSRKNGLQIRVKSGGHDYEGLSFLCKNPFVIIDLINLHAISINLEDETAWIQSGATLGELYYAISHKSSVHGFPAGLCPSVGVGGHFSGGGIGTMMRKHGLAADNILDAYIVDVNGRILDRKAMGEGLFWSIRGGGGASFAVIFSWKIKLVRVPNIVTVFTMQKKLDQEGMKLVEKWQEVAPKIPLDLFIRVVIQNGENQTVVALFNSLFLGPKEKLVRLMSDEFPELGLQTQNCNEMSWIESALYFAGFSKGQALEVLLNRTVQYKSKFKAKTDFVVQPLPESVLKEISERIPEEQLVYLILDPLGGKMDEISDYEIPFPHRKGNLYNIQYLVKWEENGLEASTSQINWIGDLYEYMKPYVSKSPRAGYINYRDLDLGINLKENASYSQAKIWGKKYFKGNFKRLANVKSQVDPGNFFSSEQSIPLLVH
ncbi:berberine bridge enzyme-like 22 [Coffea arabica]|uniref:Berberine bridge enzyme-like 22 n=1 Tax=Coffea arabica TaxID=13443 RepID=A0ABM4VMG4_COFAR